MGRRIVYFLSVAATATILAAIARPYSFAVDLFCVGVGVSVVAVALLFFKLAVLPKRRERQRERQTARQCWHFCSTFYCRPPFSWEKRRSLDAYPVCTLDGLIPGIVAVYSARVTARGEVLLSPPEDARPILRKFANRCALSVAHLWDMPVLTRRYLETGDETLRDAAREESINISKKATRKAAAAAFAAARAATATRTNAVEIALWTAEDAAKALDAPVETTRKEQNEMLEALLHENTAALRRLGA